MEDNFKDVVPCERFLGIETPDPIYSIGEQVRNRKSIFDIVLVVRDVCWNSQYNRWEYGLNFKDGRSYSNTMPESWIKYSKVSTHDYFKKFLGFLLSIYDDLYVAVFDRPPK